MRCKDCVFVYLKTNAYPHNKYYFEPVWWECQISRKKFHPNDPLYDKASFEPDDDRVCDCNDKRITKLKYDLESIEMRLKATLSSKARYEAQLEDGK